MNTTPFEATMHVVDAVCRLVAANILATESRDSRIVLMREASECSDKISAILKGHQYGAIAIGMCSLLAAICTKGVDEAKSRREEQL